MPSPDDGVYVSNPDANVYIEAAKTVRVSPRPIPANRGDWWFRRWTVTAPSLDGLDSFVMPAPVLKQLLLPVW
ncbi:hypothetical protein L3i22_087270 [Actinoplanes sp. L3-i22]|nr:hypothetical protein L3i22_087270 [Actinoplanes sp. L3-i22]